jgi:hypothetical protein
METVHRPGHDARRRPRQTTMAGGGHG